MSLIDNLFDPAVLSGLGSGVLGFVGGAVGKARGRVAKLEAEVADCRKRDAHWKILKVGVLVMVDETRRERPDSEALRTMSRLFEQAFGETPSLNDFEELLKDIDDAAA